MTPWWSTYFVLMVIQIVYSIDFDRYIYNSDRANIRHDGFMLFSNHTSTNLTFKWQNNYASEGYCSFFQQKVFVNGVLYCISNSPDDGSSHTNEGVIAIDVINGDIIWQKYIHNDNKNNYSSLNGLAYIKDKNAVSIVDITKGIITVLDAIDGNIIQNITYKGITNDYCGSDNKEFCVASYILGVNDGIFGWYHPFYQDNKDVTIISYNLMDGKDDPNYFINETDILSSILTICNNVLISTDESSIVNAYQIDDNLNIIKHLWQHTINIGDVQFYTVPVCIVFDENSSQILISATLEKVSRMISVLIQIETGNVLNEDIRWPSSGVSPVIHYSQSNDTEILLILSTGFSTICYQINDKGYYKWETLWEYKMHEQIRDLLVVNNILYQSTNQRIVGIDVISGKLKDELSFGNDGIWYSQLIAGQDASNNVWLIANCMLANDVTVYAFS